MAKFQNKDSLYTLELNEWLIENAKKLKGYRPATEEDLKLKGRFRLYSTYVFSIEKAREGLMSVDDFSWFPALDLNKDIEEFEPYERQRAIEAMRHKNVYVNIKPLPSKAELERQKERRYAEANTPKNEAIDNLKAEIAEIKKVVMAGSK